MVRRLCDGERIRAFLDRLVAEYGTASLTAECSPESIPLPLPDGNILYCCCPGVPAERREWLGFTLTALLGYEFELCDVTRELSAVYEELTLLYRLSEGFAGTLDPELIRTQTIAEIAESLEVKRVSLLMIDPGKEQMILAAGLGVHDEDIGRPRFAQGRGLAWKVVQERTSIIANDVSRFPEYVPGQTPEKNVLLVPLITKRGIIGVLTVGDKLDDAEFSSKDEKLLAAIAHQMGVSWDNVLLYQEARELFLSTVAALSAAIDAKDPYTHGHSQRVTEFAMAIADQMDLSREEKENIRIAALLHDIGKLGISENILRKPDRLTGEEFAQIKKHPAIGADIMGRVRNLLRFIPGMIDHHEKYDGTGYPEGRKGEAISLAGRIIAVADTLDAMTSDRPYHPDRRGKPEIVAIQEIHRCRGSHFDPAVVDGFLRAHQKGLILTQSGEREKAAGSG
jgi:putative nucleotidyltransferase with HDIG domain